MSVLRLLLLPVFVWLLLGRSDAANAGWVLALIGATDWLDGYLARRLSQVSELGKLLDPLADRIAVVVAVIAGQVSGAIPIWFMSALLLREALVGTGALVLFARTRQKIDVRKLGKLAFTLIGIAIVCLFLGVGYDFDPARWGAYIPGVPGLLLYYLTGVQYLGDIRSLLTKSIRVEVPK